MLEELNAQLQTFVAEPCVSAARERLNHFVQSRQRIFILANGGTFANCEHVALDWIKQKRLDVDMPSSGGLLTCFGNDFGFENLYAKYLEHRNLDEHCLIIALSSSGSSKNILNACEYGERVGAELWTGWGFSRDRPLSRFGKLQFFVDSQNYNVIEIVHLAILLSL